MKNNLINTATLAVIAVSLILVVIYLIRKMKKTKDYFTISELEKSDTAQKLGIDNTAPVEARKALSALIQNVLNPAREAYGAPVYVNSGYRSNLLNKSVGGRATSQHLKGEAADLDTKKGKVENERLFKIIRSLGNYDQLINEKDYSWVHVSWKNNGNNRHQILSA